MLSHLGVTGYLSDKTFVGLDITGFENTGKYRPISRVTLWVDDSNCLTAGDDTGIEIEADCPHATQEMVNALLSQLHGYQYQSYTADAANVDPAAELGDGITVSGVYSTLSRMSDDGNGFPDISAPGEVALEEEYPSAGPMTQEFNRQIAETRSRITKTSGEIRLEVENEIKGLSASIAVELDNITQRVEGLDGEFTEVSTTLDGLTIKDSTGETKIKGSAVYTPNLYVDAANINGTLTANQIDATNLHVNAANIDGELTIGQLPNSVATTGDIPQYTSELINNSGYQTESGVTTIVRGTVTTDYVNALGVSARYLQGQSVYLLNSGGGIVGAMTMTGASSSSYAVDLTSYGALRLTASYGAAYLQGGGGAAVGCSNEVSINGGNLRPANSGLSCGTAAYPWSAVYANTSTIQTSDKNQKNNIEVLPEKYLVMMEHITPRRYKLNDGTSGRYHPGFVAQEVKAAMDAAGVDDTEFGGWCLDHDVDGNEVQMLRMEEFIPILWAKIKQLEAKIDGTSQKGSN